MENNNTNTNEQSTAEVPATIEPVVSSEQAPKESEYVFNENTIMASLSYLGPLVLIPFLTSRDKSFIVFHVKQGLVLFGLLLVTYFITLLSFGVLAPITGLINVFIFVLSVIGILNALKQKEVAIPLVGKFANKITL